MGGWVGRWVGGWGTVASVDVQPARGVSEGVVPVQPCASASQLHLSFTPASPQPQPRLLLRRPSLQRPAARNVHSRWDARRLHDRRRPVRGHSVRSARLPALVPKGHSAVLPVPLTIAPTRNPKRAGGGRSAGKCTSDCRPLCARPRHPSTSPASPCSLPQHRRGARRRRAAADPGHVGSRGLRPALCAGRHTAAPPGHHRH